MPWRERLLNYLIRRALVERSAHYVIALIWKNCRRIHLEDNEATTYFYLRGSLDHSVRELGYYTAHYLPPENPSYE